MYLKKLEMRGFKSFADRTSIEFENGVTCIVGPNGSGKSNITDGVRWVLGEQRAKTLRGSKMEDIIFNGTGHRKKLGMAEVTLTFDNSQRFFELDYNEVKVCRRVYRSGESEYLINDTACRLKDVRDLFMDTGIGTDGYSIIGQGRIERVLSNNIDERRQLFEEAAGIVKYKSRKRETERKLDNTEANLVRIEDIYLELSKRVEPLRIESEKAKEHIELTSALSELEMNVFINEIETVDKKIAKEDLKIQEVQETLEVKDREKQAIEAEKAGHYKLIEGLKDRHKAVENAFYEEKNALAALDGDLHVQAVKLENLSTDQNRLKALIEDNQSKLADLKTEKDDHKTRRDDLEDRLKSLTQGINDHQRQFEDLSKSLYDAKEANESMRQDMITKMNEISTMKTEIGSYEGILESHQRRQVGLEEELKTIQDQFASAEDDQKAIQTSLQALSQKYQEVASKQEELKLEEVSKTKAIETLQEEKMASEKKLTESTTEMHLLKQMEKDHAGYDHSVKKALQMVDRNPQLEKGLSGVVASLMEIPKRYEVALEVAFGKSIQNLVVDTPDDAKAMIAELKRTKGGRVTFIPLSTISSKGDQRDQVKALEQLKGYIGKANHLFDYDDKYATLYDYLVGRTVIVDTVDTATQALKIKNLKYKVVTLEGDVFVPGGTITGGSYKSRNSGLLSRKRKITELEESVEDLKTRLKDHNKTIEIYRQDKKKLVTDLQDLRDQQEGLRQDLSKSENELALIRNKMDQSHDVIKKRRQELEVICQDIVSVKESIKTRQDKITAYEAMTKSLEDQMSTDDSKVEDLQAKIYDIREKLTELKVEQGSMAETFKGLTETLDRLNKSHGDLISLSENAQEDMIKNQEAMDEINRLILIFQEKKNKLLEASENQTQVLNAILEEIKQKEAVGHTFHAKKEEVVDYMESLKDTLHRFEIKRAKYDVHRDDIATRLFERYEMTPEEALEKKKEIDVTSANKEIASIKRALKQLGDVNVHAIEEYEEVSERYVFLKTQHDDLQEARGGLKKLIRSLEKEMKEKFLACFEEVKGHFSDIFESLFVGGVAELEISDMDQVLESDILIKVQPPGKKLQNLGLLSGGEKALTAIALLFAILKTKPAPFCILDEIEAALDDVNVYRFADFLKEFTQSSQFVIITHRKGTMEIADNLFGVTMAEFGVSKMISVKLEDAILE